MIDRMTGFLNKEASEKKIRELCEEAAGFLCILDLEIGRAHV